MITYYTILLSIEIHLNTHTETTLVTTSVRTNSSKAPTPEDKKLVKIIVEIL